MKIGIDGRLLTEPITGIGRYTFEAIAAMLDQSAQIRIYCPSRPTDAVLEKFPKKLFRFGGYISRPARLAWSQSALSKWAAEDDVDVFWGPTHRLPSYLPKHISSFVTIHDLVWKHAGETMRPANRWLDKMMMPGAIRRADQIFAVSDATASDIMKEWPEAAGKVSTIYPGIAKLPPPQTIEALQKLGIFGSYFLFVGTLEPRKNLPRLLQAYRSVLKSKPDFLRFVITGGKGWGKISIEQLINELDLQKHVISTGYASDQDLATLYAHARFLAMPSLYEGFGLPLIEAMSFGTPVLTSDRSSMPEIAGDAGLYVQPTDIHSIAHGIESLLCDKTLRLLRDNAKKNAQRFSWDKTAHDMLERFVSMKRETTKRILL